MPTIIEIKRTCIACPSQWEGKLDNGNTIYIRYRWGAFTIGEGKTMDEAVWNQNLHIPYGDEFDGFMSNKTMIELVYETEYNFTTDIEEYLIDTNDEELKIDTRILDQLLKQIEE